MSTYDPSRPDPTHRPRSRRIRFIYALCVAMVGLALLPLIVSFSDWALTVLAVTMVGLSIIVTALAWIPAWLDRPAPARDEEQAP